MILCKHYPNPVLEVEKFNETVAGELKLPVSQLGYYCISHYDLLAKFASSEIGMKIMEMLFSYSHDAGKFADFFMKMIEKCTDEKNTHFVGINTLFQLVVRAKNTWYVFGSNDYSKYNKNDIDVYSDCGMTYIADTYPTVLVMLYSCEVLLCDEEITDNILEYDDEIFNESYDYDYDDSEEDDDDYTENDYDNSEEYDDSCDYDDSDDSDGEYDNDYCDDEDDDDSEYSDLSDVDQDRINSESEYAENIIKENELNKKIREDNPDLIITSDGSYPEYYNQKKRVVVIGREDRGLDGADYNETVLEGYKNKKIGVSNGYRTPNGHTTHRRILKYAKGLENDLEYSDIENANELADELGEKNGFSFAFVNASKASNMKDDSQVLNKTQYDDFIERNKKNGYLEEQMEILEPDIAIGMNLSDDTIDCLGKATKISEEGSSSLYDIETENGEHYDFINLGSHLSSPFVNEEDLYNEARKLSKKKK